MRLRRFPREWREYNKDVSCSQSMKQRYSSPDSSAYSIGTNELISLHCQDSGCACCQRSKFAISNCFNQRLRWAVSSKL